MRIALVHPSFRRFGGAEEMTLRFAAQLLARGHEVALHTLDPPPVDAGPARVALLRVARWARWSNHRDFQVLSVGRDLRRALGGAERLVAGNYPALRWVARALGGARGAPPVVWYCHEPSRRLHRAVTDPHTFAARDADGFGAHLVARAAHLRSRERWRWRLERRSDARAVARADRVAANSRHTAGLLERIYGRPAAVLPCGVEVPEKPSEAPREPLLLAVSGLNATKNVHAAVETFCRLAPSRPALRLLCVGEGRERAALEARLARDGLRGRAELPGRLSAPALAAAYDRAAVLLYPALDEPLGLVPLEAMARATPVVVSDHGGPAETVVDGETGFHADPLRPERWAQCVAALLDDPALARRMGEAGRARVRAHYDASRCLAELARFVEEATCASPST